MLRFRSDGTFRILLFGDLHEHADYAESPKFRDMQKLMNAALDADRPDLCVLLGDNCNVTWREDPAGFAAMVQAVCAPMTARGIPIAAVMGNHEHDPGCDAAVVETYRQVPGCLMRNDAPGVTGAANYRELIYDADGKTPLFCLWFLDSNNLYPDRAVSHYDIVYPDQIAWFERESAALREMNGGRTMPSFVFQHTPVPEEYRLLRKAKWWERPVSVKGYNTRSHTRYMLRSGCEGYLGEGPCAPDIGDGQFESWQRVGGVLGAFFGHDHLNDMSGYVDGIFLAQHKTAGFRAYTDGCRSCVRLLTLDQRNLTTFTQELQRFKQFGLKSESLGPILRTFTDRQSINTKITCAALGGIAALAGAGAAIQKLTEVHRNVK